jgi:signal peptidase I
MDNIRNEMRPAGWGRALWGGLLSLLMPGIGQIYARSWRLGVVLLGIGLGLTVCFRTLQSYPLNPAVCAAFILLSGAMLAFAAGAGIDAVRRIRNNRCPVPTTVGIGIENPARPDRLSRQGVEPHGRADHDVGAGTDGLTSRRTGTGGPRWMYSAWFSTIVYLLIVIILHFVLPAQATDHWRAFSIPSASNLPTLLVGDVVIAQAIPAGTLPARGDIVVFTHPQDASTFWIKRVVGLPGDRIFLRSGQVFINDQPVSRSAAASAVAGDFGLDAAATQYIETLPDGRSYPIIQQRHDGWVNNTPEYNVPAGHIFTLGDNRDNSADSRFLNGIGYIPLETLGYRADILLYSIDRQYPWWQVWKWPSEIRWSRFDRPLQ